jgi:hypothetical protein
MVPRQQRGRRFPPQRAELAFTFITRPFRFVTLTLAYMLNSLARVSRRGDHHRSVSIPAAPHGNVDAPVGSTHRFSVSLTPVACRPCVTRPKFFLGPANGIRPLGYKSKLAQLGNKAQPLPPSQRLSTARHRTDADPPDWSSAPPTPSRSRARWHLPEGRRSTTRSRPAPCG